MLYLNYGMENATPKNAFGGEDDLGAKDFIKQFNDVMHKNFPGFLTFAEESSAYQGVTAPTYLNGLGFDYKWNMGWMNDTLDYFSSSPSQKQHNHDKITFSSVYMRDEKFILPLSHDEVVHGKKQLPDKLPGDDWKKFALLRTLFAYQMFHPGKKLNFMGNEIGQRMEWRFYETIEWFMLKYPIHDSFHEYVKRLNEIYLDESALHEMDSDVFGFEWIDGDNRAQSVFSFIRRAKDGSEIIAVLNMSENDYRGFRLGLPGQGEYYELISSNLEIYDGTGLNNPGNIISEETPSHGRPQSIVIDIPALSAAAFIKR
jgi:1,4-alpha-glucan branching enzyme